MHYMTGSTCAPSALLHVKKSPSCRQLPAYQRYASLVATGNLPIPIQYKVLGEKFRCSDTVVNMLQKRDEVCTLSKLKKAVQDMMRRCGLLSLCTSISSVTMCLHKPCHTGHYVPP